MMVNRVRMPMQAKMETKERKDKFLQALSHQRSRASCAQPARQALSDNLDQKDLQDQRVSQRTRPTTERRATKACQDHKAFQDPLDHPVPPARKDNQEESSKSMDQLDRPESVDNLEASARKEAPAAMEELGSQALKARRVALEMQDLKEIQVSQVQLDHKASQVQKELAIIVHLRVPHPAIKQLTGEQILTSDLLHKPIQLVHRLLSLLFILMCQSSHYQRTKSIHSHSRTS